VSAKVNQRHGQLNTDPTKNPIGNLIMRKNRIDNLLRRPAAMPKDER
jgi:hypothetical protein